MDDVKKAMRNLSGIEDDLRAAAKNARSSPREGFDLLAEAEKRLTLARIEYKKRAGAWGMVLDECRELENLLKNTYRLYP